MKIILASQGFTTDGMKQIQLYYELKSKVLKFEIIEITLLNRLSA